MLLILAVVLYPIGYGIRQSFLNFRFGHAVGSVGFDNYRQLLSDPAFGQALWVTFKFVVIAVTIETTLGLGLAMLVANELPFARIARLILIVPMIVTPIVVGIVFRLIYASDVGLLTTLRQDIFGGGQVFILDKGWSAFLGLVALDVWEWTPLMFLIILAGLHSLPQDPMEAARVDGASAIQVFFHHTLPLLRPVLLVAVVLRTIDAVGTFDQVIVLTKGGPGTATQLISVYAYNTAFLFSQYGRAMAMLIGLLACLLVLMAAAVHLMRRSAEIVE
jgi:multiple sugar transport system permease protein